VLRRYKIIKWRASRLFKQLQNKLQPLKADIDKHIKPIWFSLSTAQKLYLAALISVIFFKSWSLCALLTMTALVIEFWPKFNKLWHSLAGKALILVFYATIANFVLANASSIVNDVTHVSAANMSYTHNFATLIYLPIWALGITLCTLLIFQFILPFYIIMLLLIKPFGSQSIKYISQSYSPLLTASIRLILAFITLSTLYPLLDDRDEATFLSDIENGFYFGRELASDSPEVKGHAMVNLNERLAKQETKTQPSSPKAEEINEFAESASSFVATEGYFGRSKHLIAMFAFNYEADEYSRCKKAKNSKVVELNDYEIVEITPNETMPYGYSFIVKACESPAFKSTS